MNWDLFWTSASSVRQVVRRQGANHRQGKVRCSLTTLSFSPFSHSRPGQMSLRTMKSYGTIGSQEELNVQPKPRVSRKVSWTAALTTRRQKHPPHHPLTTYSSSQRQICATIVAFTGLVLYSNNAPRPGSVSQSVASTPSREYEKATSSSARVKDVS